VTRPPMPILCCTTANPKGDAKRGNQGQPNQRHLTHNPDFPQNSVLGQPEHDNDP
jgi:hypothetical protein